MKKLKDFLFFIKDLFKNRALVWNLAKNDFKVSYAGSYLGIVWAFVQPVITILVFWFVFEVGFRSGGIQSVPFILWFSTGLIPWFFFSAAWNSATNCLTEYNYLVKKIVFRVSVLPVVKIISALFVHAFFIVFLFFLYFLYGFVPHIVNIQVLYYSFCMCFLVLGLSFITSSFIIFFKDTGQILSIVLQFGMWLTPIMWSYQMIPENYRWVLKLNPMYYIVEGYRDTFINHVWFFYRYNQFWYFWTVSSAVFIFGALMFRKLRPHFSDVL